MATIAVFPHLNTEQAGGMQCVVCHTSFREVAIDHVPVGQATTGGQVFACVVSCAPLIGHVPAEAGR